jgi:hypothetical protein
MQVLRIQRNLNFFNTEVGYKGRCARAGSGPPEVEHLRCSTPDKMRPMPRPVACTVANTVRKIC